MEAVGVSRQVNDHGEMRQLVQIDQCVFHNFSNLELSEKLVGGCNSGAINLVPAGREWYPIASNQSA